MPTETIQRLISEYNAANSGAASAKADLRLSTLLARDNNDGPDRDAFHDLAYKTHVDHVRAVIRANRAHIAVCRALDDRTMEFDTRMTLVNAICGGIRREVEVHHG